MRKRLTAVVAGTVLVGLLAAASVRYYQFVSETIFNESSAHLSEIYHQANQSLDSLVGKHWSSMHMWASYLRDVTDADLVDAYVADACRESGFTDFYFIARDGGYRTTDGKSGYLDFGASLPGLIIDDKDVAVSSVVPGRPEIMVFAVPAEPGSYRGFAYEAIAISFNNADLIETLEITAFEGRSSTYVVHPDGRVIIDNAGEQVRDVYNVLAMLRSDAGFSDEQVEALQRGFLEGQSDVIAFTAGGAGYYLVYEPASFQDWVVLGIVPTAVVNASMNQLQAATILLTACVVVGLGAAVVAFILERSRNAMRKKDVELQYREELFSVLSSNVDDIFVMLDAQTLRVDYISPNIERLAGITEREVREDVHALDRLVQDRSSGLILDELPAIGVDEQAGWDRAYVHQGTGEPRWFHSTGLCRQIEGEKKYILVLSDRTDEHRINRELEDAVNMARRANQAKSAFLSSMSHDIRTPMNAVIGFATLAAGHVEDPNRVRGYLAKILSSGNHLLSLINDVLDMSRIESGKIRLEEQPANLSDIFHDVRTIVGGQVSAKGLELFMDITDVTDEDVYCDKTRLNQVLLNLLSNAIKFTPSGGSVAVRVAQLPGAPEGRGLYQIRVEDTGVGMSPEFAARVFEPFERERTSTASKIQGTGLGMAITKNIVDMMGGSIEVRTAPGKGTAFTVRLELRLQSDVRADERIEGLGGVRALVVDDDFNTCDGVAKMLVRAGLRSEWTLSGREAVLRARQSVEMGDPFGVYIVDWRLPDMNGIEVARQIRGLGDDTPIIILTAYDWSDIEAEAREAGVTAFCPKPMFMSDLREALLGALGCTGEEGAQTQAASSDEDAFEGKRVLLVEDNELNREIALEILGGLGLEVDTAQNGAEAVELVAAGGPAGGRRGYDLVLMDIQMPVMDGCEATRRIRALPDPRAARTPVLAMTANAFEEDRRAAEACGMDGFLSKPVRIEELVEALRAVLG